MFPTAALNIPDVGTDHVEIGKPCQFSTLRKSDMGDVRVLKDCIYIEKNLLCTSPVSECSSMLVSLVGKTLLFPSSLTGKFYFSITGIGKNLPFPSATVIKIYSLRHPYRRTSTLSITHKGKILRYATPSSGKTWYLQYASSHMET